MTCPQSRRAGTTRTVADDPNVAMFGEQLKDTQAQPVSRDLERDLGGDQRRPREDDDRTTSIRRAPRTRCRQKAESDRHGRTEMTAPALVQRDVAEAGAPPAPVRHGWREDLIGWAFAAPFVILFGIFLALPILAALALSFTSFGLRDLAEPDRDDVRRARELPRPPRPTRSSGRRSGTPSTSSSSACR